MRGDRRAARVVPGCRHEPVVPGTTEVTGDPRTRRSFTLSSSTEVCAERSKPKGWGYLFMSKILIMRIMRRLALLLIIGAVPIEASATKVVLRDPPELVLQGAEVLSEAIVQRIILDALNRSSLRNWRWTVEANSPDASWPSTQPLVRVLLM